VRGSAPDIYGKHIANPIGMICSGAMMLDFLGGEAGRQAHDAILAAVETVLREGPLTPDAGGKAGTSEVGKAITAAL
ncbi:MAG: tartrate dehydrogenase, partial [Cupriavidus sp.]|nr:tartrate dehydrogenase [Cupriavidus sp.]